MSDSFMEDDSANSNYVTIKPVPSGGIAANFSVPTPEGVILLDNNKPEVVRAMGDVVTHALRLPVDPQGLFHLGEVVVKYIKQHKLTFRVSSGTTWSVHVSLAPEHPPRLLRIEGPLTVALQSAPLTPRFDPKYLLVEEGESTNSTVHYSPRVLLGIVSWHQIAREELRTSEENGEPFRLLVGNTRTQNRERHPPFLPYCMFPEAYDLIAAKVRRKKIPDDFPTLQELYTYINHKAIPLDKENPNMVLWTQTTSKKIAFRPSVGYANKWANAVTGFEPGGAKAMFPEGISVTPRKDLVALLPTDEEPAS